MLSSLVDKTFQSLSKKKYISEKKLINTLFTKTKMVLTWESCIFYLRFRSVYLMFLVDLSYQTVKLLPNKFQDTWIFALNLLCKIAGNILKTESDFKNKIKMEISLLLQRTW